MPRFSTRSTDRLSTCHKSLELLMTSVVKEYDISIICGHRDFWDQDKAYKSGNSKLNWPNSKHNSYPSRAVDVVPYPTMWDSIEQFYFMAGVIHAHANMLEIDLRWGGDWDRDFDFSDSVFLDLGHFELL